MGENNSLSEAKFLVEVFENIIPELLLLPKNTKILFNDTAIALQYLSIMMNQALLDTFILMKIKNPDTAISYQFL